MFQTIKQNVSLVDLIAKDLGVDFTPVGSSNMAIANEKDFGGCPFCSHMDCFRVKVPEEGDEEQTGMYKCFSCGEHGDVITWRVKRAGGEDKLSHKDAAIELGKEFGIALPRGGAKNPIQEIFTHAARYYQNCLLDCGPRTYVELGGMTPLQYQLEHRGHSLDVLKRMQVGFSDGGLLEFLEGVGFDEEILISSGLVAKKPNRRAREYLPPNCFIYPHKVRKQVSHFTFKDPLKRLAYQLPKKFSLNGHVFYGQDSTSESDTVIIVEGENDLLSCMDSGAVSVIGAIGQLSGDQLNWMRENLSDKRVLTCFDADDAGDKYRKMVEKTRRSYLNLAHVRPPEGSDVDEQIRKEGKALQDVVSAGLCKVDLAAGEVHDKPKIDVAWTNSDRPAPMVLGSQDVEVAKKKSTIKVEGMVALPVEGMASLLEGTGLGLPGVRTAQIEASAGGTSASDDYNNDEVVDMENNPVIQARGCYHKVKYVDGAPDYVRLSDFTIRLKNVFLNENGDRHREIVVVKQNGFTSDPILVDSETKTSLKSFKILLAKAADAEWIGTEMDMCGMWKLVYDRGSDVLVRVPRAVGRHSRYGCWIFNNCLITDSGVVVSPDEDGIFWVNGKTLGIRPESLNISASREETVNGDIPCLETSLTRDETEKLMGDALSMLSRNLSAGQGMPGHALMMMGWAWANIYADLIFKINRGFPFLMLWGTNGKGKTTLGKWIQNFFGTAEHGSTSVPQLRSGVGWGRKAEYYSCLPLMVDEVRANEETRQYLGMFRSYYDREGRTLGTKSEFGVRTQSVRAGFIFCGEDQFEDPASRERCIPLRIPAVGRELSETYRWFQAHNHLLTNISYYRILDSCAVNKDDIVRGIQALDRKLVEAGCPARTSKNWAAIGYFSMQLAMKYMPEFDFEAWIIQACGFEAVIQKEDTTLVQFFEIVEGAMAQENSKVNHEHIMVEGNHLHLWFPPLYKIVVDECRGKFAFSKKAVFGALKEEPYFVSDEKKVAMGLNGTRRIVVTLDLEKCPDMIRNVARAN